MKRRNIVLNIPHASINGVFDLQYGGWPHNQYFVNNCLNKWEWTNRLRYDYYYCVIILSKETKKPLVCVDINADRNGWSIDQFYGKNNSTIYNEELLAFKEAFQEHLSGE